jgi:hypothetical protein
VTIRRGREVLDNIHISELPTCLVDLVRRASSSNVVSSSQNSQTNFREIELGNLTVTLELLCVTLPSDMTLPYKCDASHRRSISLSSRYATLTTTDLQQSVFHISFVKTTHLNSSINRTIFHFQPFCSGWLNLNRLCLQFAFLSVKLFWLIFPAFLCLRWSQPICWKGSFGMTILQRKSCQPPRLTLFKFQTKFIMFYFFNLLKKSVLEQQSIYFLLVKSNQYEAI